LDNVSHTLAGLLLAECALEASAARTRVSSPRFRALALFGSALANNFPDFDFVYTRITGGRLGYLLHHRGHTHTAPIAFLLGLAAFGLVWLIGRASLSRRETQWLAALCLVGPFVHIAMDFSNNYGVHPFWPAYDGWLYGDAVFIVEPFFFVAIVPVLAFAARRTAWRIGLGLLLLAVLGAALVLPFITKISAVALICAAVAMVIACAKSAPRTRLALGVAAPLGVAAVFFAASARAKSLLREASPSVAIRDLIVTPMPANPLCFEAWTVGTHSGSYVARRATVASLAGIVPASRCPSDDAAQPTAPLADVADPSTDDVRWRGEFVAPLAQLSELATRDCRVAALLRFVRAPYWTVAGDVVIVGDLRYDRNPGLDFADIAVSRDGRETTCPGAVPPWTPPRHDLLGRAP
jgi:inner membrane protein